MALSRHRGCYVGISVTLFAATAALALRLYARQLTRVRLGMDDYLCIVAYVSSQPFFFHKLRTAERRKIVEADMDDLGLCGDLLWFDVQLFVGLWNERWQWSR